MAHVETRETARGTVYRIKWREHGRWKSKTVTSKRAAEQLKPKIELAVQLHGRWVDPAQLPPVTVQGAMKSHMKDRARGVGAARAESIDYSLRYGLAVLQRAAPTPMLWDLDKDWLRDTWAYLTSERGQQEDGAATRIRDLQRFWRWSFEEYGDLRCPYPQTLELPRAEPQASTTLAAPTWAEMDAAVWSAYQVRPYLDTVRRWGRLYELCRGTGLRPGQVRRLLWTDVDLVEGVLTVRPELGKTRQERKGRRVPLAPVLLESLAGWGKREGRLVPGRGERLFRFDSHARTRAIWTRAGVRPAVWRMPQHCFRHGFVTELKRAGADTEAVEYLVGHDQGVRGRYLDPAGLWEAMVEAVARVPAVAATGPLKRVGALQ